MTMNQGQLNIFKWTIERIISKNSLVFWWIDPEIIMSSILKAKMKIETLNRWDFITKKWECSDWNMYILLKWTIDIIDDWIILTSMEWEWVVWESWFANELSQRMASVKVNSENATFIIINKSFLSVLDDKTKIQIYENIAQMLSLKLCQANSSFKELKKMISDLIIQKWDIVWELEKIHKKIISNL